MAESKQYDVAIIGAGPGGYVAGIRAGQLGLKAVVIDRDPNLGGVCLNWGCIPTKALIKNAEMVHFVQDKAESFGIGLSGITLDWAKAVDRSRGVVMDEPRRRGASARTVSTSSAAARRCRARTLSSSRARRARP
ncbi:MAG: FAD-dependent oxidoreductase [Anaerolineae bacterium]